MTANEATAGSAEVNELLTRDADFLRPLVQALVQEALEAEMTAALGAAKGERTAARLGATGPATTSGAW
jgi:putative transposase